MLRIASVLLVAVLLTTCIISGAFAKYVTDKTSADNARVAKFGVVISADVNDGTELADDLYLTAYATDEEDGYAGAQSVVSSVTDKLMAPGTTQTWQPFDVTGTPEVAVRTSYEATVELEGWTLEDDSIYFPLEVNIYDQGTKVPVSFDGCTTLDAYEAKIKAAIDAVTHDYDANQNLNQVDDDLKVEWIWAFSTTGNDVNDTYLGDQAAADNAATFSISVKATITQID